MKKQITIYRKDGVMPLYVAMSGVLPSRFQMKQFEKTILLSFDHGKFRIDF